jgi:hypothetical protein
LSIRAGRRIFFLALQSNYGQSKNVKLKANDLANNTIGYPLIKKARNKFWPF